MNRRSFQLTLAAAALAPHALLRAQEPWPGKPIKVVLSQPAGSGPDNIARLLGDGMAQSLGQPFVIDNKPGGQNVIGAQAVAHSAPDGYTLYFATTAALVTNSYLFKTLPYDPLKDFTPVAFVANSPFALLVSADSQITSVQDLIARSKAEPGKLSIANEGPRTFGGMIARLFNARSKAGANLVSYSSNGVAVQDVLGGHSNAIVADVASTAQLVRQGRLRMLAVTSGQRIEGWKQVETVGETLPGFDMVGWMALVAPAGTPPSIVNRVNAELDKALRDKDAAEKIHNVGPVTEGAGSPAQLGEFLAGEHRQWAQITKEIGVLPE